MKRYARNHPRVPTDIPVEVALPDGELIHATAVNLSPAGVQIAGDRVTVDRILPLGEARPPAKGREMHIRLRIPESSGSPDVIGTWCTAVFSRRLAADEYRIGLQFDRLEADASEKLERFLEDTVQRVGF